MSGVLGRPAPVDLDATVRALARRDGIRIMPDGLVAANQLGLTNAVPVKASYVTDGHSRTLKVDGRTDRFRHAAPSVLTWAGRPSAPVVQALRWLGRHSAADAEVVATLRRRLPDPVKRDLPENRQDLPGTPPTPVFRGGTCLSKGSGLVGRFSEDIGPDVPRGGPGFERERDPAASGLSNRRRNAPT